MEVSIGTELFTAKGTIIKEKNYLEVFKYEKQTENFLPLFRVGERVLITDCHVEESWTTVILYKSFEA